MILDGAMARLKRSHNDRAWLAWHIAVLGRVKRLPRLRELLIAEPGAKRRQQTVEDQIRIARLWDAAINRSQH